VRYESTAEPIKIGYLVARRLDADGVNSYLGDRFDAQ
jgi:hypothetical protein